MSIKAITGKRWKGKGLLQQNDVVMIDGEDTDLVIPARVLGLSGVGKSTFINALIGNASTRKASVGHDLQSHTHQAEHFIIKHPREPSRRLIIVDTPGFDHTEEDDSEILRRIAVWLAKSYSDSSTLAGVVYLAEISQPRPGHALRTSLEVFRCLCGDEAVRNVVLVTTKWDTVSNELGVMRERQLRDKYWANMLRLNATMLRFEANASSAWKIINHTLDRRPVGMLLIQQELVDYKKALSETAAGRILRGRSSRDSLSTPEKKFRNPFKQWRAETRTGGQSSKSPASRPIWHFAGLRDAIKTRWSVRLKPRSSANSVIPEHDPGVLPGLGVDAIAPLHSSDDLFLTSIANVEATLNAANIELNEALPTPDIDARGVEFDVTLTRDTPFGEPPKELAAVAAKISVILSDVGKYRKLLQTNGSKAQKVLDMFQTLLDSPGLNAEFRRHLIVATQRLSRRTGIYPRHLILDNVELESEHALSAGGFADIYKGRLVDHSVCLKVVRLYQTSSTDKFLKQISSEAILWSQLSHPNLLPTYGLHFYKSLPCFISPWMENGDVNHYLREKPSACRMLLVRDVVTGLAYIHDLDIIHGDLKGPNILVDTCGHARLADFGLSAVSDTNVLHWSTQSASASKGGSVRWQAPELFDEERDEVVHNTKPSDVYAFTSVAYEVLAGAIPFFEYKLDAAVIAKVLAGVKPSQPPPLSSAWRSWGLTDSFWSLMEAGWSTDPSNRPTIHEILSRRELQQIVDDRPIEAGNISPAYVRQALSARLDSASTGEIESLLDHIHSRPL